MDISVQALKRAQIVDVKGRIDSSSAPQLDDKLKQLRDAGNYNIVLDLSGVDYMSSAALRAIVSALRDCKRHGGDVFLANPSSRVGEVLELAGLTSLFQIFDDKTSAVGSF
jgi:anti-sigma B factor antagonist